MRQVPWVASFGARRGKHSWTLNPRLGLKYSGQATVSPVSLWEKCPSPF